VILGVALAGGAASRLARADPPHVGLNFRKDEVESFLHTPTSTKLLGQGLAGRFPGKDVNGRPAPAGWAHELPVWIALKAGLLGLLCAALAVIVILRRALGALRNTNGSAQPLVGVAIVVGLLGVSMTLDRLALPEGIPLLMLGVFLISADAPSTRAGA
jgi:O-antigen ligase